MCDEYYIEVILFSCGVLQQGKLEIIVCDGEICDNVLVYGVFDNVDVCLENCYDEWNMVFKQFVLNVQYQFIDDFKVSGKIGILCLEYENLIQIMVIMDKFNVKGYSYDYCGNSCFLVLNYGIDFIDLNGWILVEICLCLQWVKNDFDIVQVDFNWNISFGFCLKGGFFGKDYSFVMCEWWCGFEIVVFNFVIGNKWVLVDMIEQVGLGGIIGLLLNWVVFSIDVFNQLFDIYSNIGMFVFIECVVNVCSVEEKDCGGYLMGEFFIELGLILFLGNFGVCYVKIKQSFIGYVIVSGVLVQSIVDCEYSDILFLLNLVVELILDFLVCFGVVKVMVCLGLGSLIFGVIVNVSGGVCIVSGGNLNFDLICVNIVDFGVEWYFSEGVMLGLVLFYKDIESVVQIVCEVCLYLFSGLLLSLLEGIGVGLDDDFVFSVLFNIFGGKFKGLEVNYIQFFIFLFGCWFNFGLQLNYIYVDLQIQYFIVIGVNLFNIDLIGLFKNLWNVMLFYEGLVFVVCVLVINCDDYLIQVFVIEVGFDVYGMIGIMVIDVLVCYKISDQFELSLEVVNLINEVFDEWVGLQWKLLLQYIEIGCQYLFGLCYKF